MAPPDWAFQPENYEQPPHEDLLCSICQMVFCNPIECPCNHVFCNKCIKTWIETHRDCPICRKRARKKSLHPVNRIIKNLINDLKLRCKNASLGCDTKVTIEACEAHLKVCLFETENCPNKCGMSMYRRDINKHIQEECIYREGKTLRTYPGSSHYCTISEVLGGSVPMNGSIAANYDSNTRSNMKRPIVATGFFLSDDGNNHSRRKYRCSTPGGVELNVEDISRQASSLPLNFVSTTAAGGESSTITHATPPGKMPTLSLVASSGQSSTTSIVTTCSENYIIPLEQTRDKSPTFSLVASQMGRSTVSLVTTPAESTAVSLVATPAERTAVSLVTIPAESTAVSLVATRRMPVNQNSFDIRNPQASTSEPSQSLSEEMTLNSNSEHEEELISNSDSTSNDSESIGNDSESIGNDSESIGNDSESISNGSDSISNGSLSGLEYVYNIDSDSISSGSLSSLEYVYNIDSDSISSGSLSSLEYLYNIDSDSISSGSLSSWDSTSSE